MNASNGLFSEEQYKKYRPSLGLILCYYFFGSFKQYLIQSKNLFRTKIMVYLHYMRNKMLRAKINRPTALFDLRDQEKSQFRLTDRNNTQ